MAKRGQLLPFRRKGSSQHPGPLFDLQYYTTQNPDVVAASLDPLLHYIEYGWKEGRDPSAAFSTDKYLAANPDVVASGINPLLHYLIYGAAEGRGVHPV